MKIAIKGTIIPNDYAWIYDYCEIENTSPSKVEKALLEADGEEVEIDINSGGGDVFAGSEIYTAIRAYKGNVKIHVVGLAASAASVIAMAAKSDISPTAQLMVHNVSMATSGDYRDMDHASDVLKNANEAIANAYVIKSGMRKEQALKLMDRETWLDAEKAVEYGLIDEIAGEHEKMQNAQMVAAFGSTVLPMKFIDKMLLKKNELKADIEALKNKEV